MKKFAMLLVVLSVGLFSFGCGETKKTETKKTETKVETKTEPKDTKVPATTPAAPEAPKTEEAK